VSNGAFAAGRKSTSEVNPNAGSILTQLMPDRFCTGLTPQGSWPAPETWKKMMGQKPVSARLSTLPEGKLSRGALASSAAFQGFLAAILFSLPMFFPQKLATKVIYEVTPIAALQTEVLLPKPHPVIRTRVQPATEPVDQPAPPLPQHVAKLLVPRELVAPKPKPIQMANQDVPPVAQPIMEAKLEAPIAEPARPRPPVQVGNLSTGSAAPAMIDKPVEKVQTGGFGDPNGASGPSDPNKHANMAHFGSPALPPGPGYGNGTDGATGARGTVVSAGFGNDVAVPPAGPAGVRAAVKEGGFATVDVGGRDTPKVKQADSTAAIQSVIILEKPNPVYSAEARKLGIEGEVLIDVVFPASGPVQVGRVIQGLGHGLDEAAIRAAQQIRFKPALQEGKPVDFPATVHIVFQLAF
jgi:TonB family protein